MNRYVDKPMWTDELILRLKGYVDASVFYVVTYRGMRVYGIEPRKPELGVAGWAGFYLSQYAQQNGDTPVDLEKSDIYQFVVQSLAPINWQKQDRPPVVET